jgi:alpha-glucosidase
MNIFPTATLKSTARNHVQLSLNGGAQFTVQALEPNLFRVTYAPATGYKEPRTWAIAPAGDVPWQGRERDSLQGFSCPPAAVTQSANSATLKTASLSATVQLSPLRIEWHDAQGNTLAADRATSSYFASPRTGAVRHYVQRDSNKASREKYYGLGDKTGPLDLNGRRLSTLALDSLGYDPQRGDPLYKHWPFVLTRAASGAWYGVYYDTLAACTFDFGCEHDNYHEPYRYVDIDDGDLDYYFMVGASPAEVVAQFVKLIGGTALPPQWSVGFAQTAMNLADAPDAQAQMSAFIDQAAATGVPISSFHYGSGYSSGQGQQAKRRYVFTWNDSKFPAPKALNAKFHGHGMKLVANIKPCLLDDHPSYGIVKAQGGFIHTADGAPVMEQFWDGVGAHLDFTNPATIAWWQASFKEKVLDYGINVGWNDNNEYAIMDDGAQCAGFDTPLPMHRARPLHAMLMTRATYEAQTAHAPNKPVYTISRGGSPGIQRYAQTWSGDNHSDWQNLKWNIRTGLQMGLSGLFNVGHDVGGFAGASPDAELLTRWVQACCLNPRMVMNSWNTDGTTTTPWLHPEVLPHTKAAIELRYQLMPYLWSLFERAHREHKAIICPTFYVFPNDERCYDDCDEFMLGDDLLVAPVVVAGQRQRAVYLPVCEGGWVDFYTRQPYGGGQTHTVDAPLGKLPLFATALSNISIQSI